MTMSCSGRDAEESVSVFIEDETTTQKEEDDDDEQGTAAMGVVQANQEHQHSEEEKQDMEQSRAPSPPAASSSSFVTPLSLFGGDNLSRTATIRISIVALSFLACVAGVVLAVILRTNQDGGGGGDEKKHESTPVPSTSPTSLPSLTPSTRPSQSPTIYLPPDEITTLLEELLPTYTLEALSRDENGDFIVVLDDDDGNDNQTPQVNALDWLRRDIEFQLTLYNINSTNNTAVISSFVSSSSSVGYPYSNDRLLQRYAMACFYFATTLKSTNTDTYSQPPSWKNDTHWLSHENHECQWYSNSFEPFGTGPLPCPNQDGVLQNIKLPFNNLFGTVPKELALLTALERLELYDNRHLGGTFWPEWKALTQLQVLYFGGTEIQGSLSESLAETLVNVRDWRCQNTQMTGSIPTAIEKMSRLEVLNLANIPTLTGTIPEELGYLPKLQVLILDNTALKGSIPLTLRFLQSLRKLSVSNNPYVNGTLDSALFTAGTAWKDSLQELWLYNNSLSAPIPTTLGEMTQLRQLHLSHNEFTSTIPTQLASLTRIERIQLRENQVTGGIPTEFGGLQQRYNFDFRFLDVSGNDLSGTFDATTNTTMVIPTELTRLPRLQNLEIFDNPQLGDLAVPNISDALCDRVTADYFHIYTDCHVTPCYCCYCREFRNETGQYVFYPPNDFLYGWMP